MKVVVYNLGCKVNKYECDSLIKALREKGNIVSEELEKADAYILNTCAVTNEAERKSRQCVERCLRLNSNAKIYVCGCASEHNANQFLKKDNVEYVIGTANKMKLVDSFDKHGENVAEISKEYEDDFSPSIERTRAYIKIQDGCNRFCSYCLIPYVRGRSRSRAISSIVTECDDVATMVKELVITGIDMSSYGKDINVSIVDLIDSLKDVKCRIRLGSLEVSVITEEFLSSLNSLVDFCPQFHLSLQSGDDNTLKRMNRHYTTNSYFEKIQLIRKYFPNAGITTDLICAFPCETDDEFNNTKSFIEKVGFSQVHIFPYSKREGTVAAKMTMVSSDIAKKRCKEMAFVASSCKTEYLNKMLGKELEVLVENKVGEYFEGYSKEYIKVKVKDAQPDTIIKVTAKSVDYDTIIAE